jgi:hypothetical protein
MKIISVAPEVLEGYVEIANTHSPQRHRHRDDGPG